MSPFLIALIPPALWGISNYIDKYLVSKVIKGGGIGALLIFSALIGLFVIAFILIFFPHVLTANPTTAFFTALNGSIYLLAVLPYLYALNKDDTSVAVALFQLGPVFQYVLAYFVLGEKLLPMQIAGGLLIIFGAIIMSLDVTSLKKIRFKFSIFWLMTLSSFLFAVNFLLFKVFALQQDFWTTSFWEYTGFSVFGICLLVFVKSYRKEFLDVMKENKVPVIGLNMLNEIVNIVGKLSFNFVSLLMPLALASVIAGIQPLFVLGYGIVLTLLFPNIIKEDIGKRVVGHKLISILMMFAGLYMLYS